MWLNAAIAVFLWCYAAVLAIAWFRAVAREPRRMHIAHFVQLMGLFVPIMAVLLGLIVIVALTGFSILLILLPFLLPVGILTAFQLEVSRLQPPSRRIEIQRLLLAAGLTVSAYIVA